MYAGMAFVPITGIMMMYFNGNALPFIGFDIPGKSVVTDADSGLAKQSAGLHVQIGSLFEILVPLHIGAVGLSPRPPHYLRLLAVLLRE